MHPLLLLAMFAQTTVNADTVSIKLNYTARSADGRLPVTFRAAPTMDRNGMTAAFAVSLWSVTRQDSGGTPFIRAVSEPELTPEGPVRRTTALLDATTLQVRSINGTAVTNAPSTFFGLLPGLLLEGLPRRSDLIFELNVVQNETQPAERRYYRFLRPETIRGAKGREVTTAVFEERDAQGRLTATLWIGGRSPFVARSLQHTPDGLAIKTEPEVLPLDTKPVPVRKSNEPGDRLAHLMVYDSLRDRLIIYGGELSVSRGDDRLDPDPRTYAWDGRGWAVIAERGPRSRDEIAFAYDPRDGSVLLFGGRGNGPGTNSADRRIAFRETWRFDGRQWILADSLGPEPRAGAVGAFDAARGRFVVFGGALGNDGRGALSTTTWEWDGTRWMRFDVTGPPGRSGHVMAYDARARRVILHGGVQSATRNVLTDTWSWDGQRWQQVSADGPRAIMGAATTAPGGGVILFGGHTLDGQVEGTWRWDGRAWSRIAVQGPEPRTFNALATDTRRNRVYLYGGSIENRPGRSRALWYLGPNDRWVRIDQ